MNIKHFALAVISIFFLSSCQSMKSGTTRAQNVIFFIGDGMGPAQMTAARLYRYGSFGQMNYERFSTTGVARTYSSREFTTDSAAAATALASGVKTYNGAIGLSDPQWEAAGRARELETLSDLAHQQGKSVGIVTTTRITHATPASFFAHVPQRDLEDEIAAQVLGSEVDLFIGGGKRHFVGSDLAGKRRDGRNILALKREAGARVVEDLNALSKVSDLKKPLLALLALDHIGYQAEGTSEAQLSVLVKKAMELLSQNPKGYLLIVEGGRIDHASHINAAKNALGEMVEFDQALAVAMDASDLDDTLIVMTADHETGGLSISGYGPHEQATGAKVLGPTLERSLKAQPRPILSWATGPGNALYPMDSAAHTAVDVAVAAMGPGEELFAGWMDNSDIAWHVAQILGVEFTRPANVEAQKVLIQKKQQAMGR